MRKHTKLIALFAGLSLAMLSLPALAYPSADTVLVSGYDADAMVVLYGTSPVDDEDTDPATLDCWIDAGDYTYVADGIDDFNPENGETEEADVTELNDGESGDAVEFDYEDDSGTVTYVDADECQLTAVEIEPNEDGKITHGTIVSTFAKLLGEGKGCLIRHFAQSDYGKADYTDADLSEDAFSVTLESHKTACEKGKPSFDGDDDDENDRGGPPPWAGPKDRDENDRGGPPPWAGPKGDD